MVFYGTSCMNGECVAICEGGYYKTGEHLSKVEKITKITSSFIKTNKRIIHVVEISSDNLDDSSLRGVESAKEQQ